MLNRILLALDSSDSGQVALSFAMAVAGPGAAVRVVHVNEFQLGGRGLTVETADEATALVADAVTELHRAGIRRMSSCSAPAGGTGCAGCSAAVSGSGCSG
jgi:nucleotide-binding universal stress UspA family protein